MPRHGAFYFSSQNKITGDKKEQKEISVVRELCKVLKTHLSTLLNMLKIGDYAHSTNFDK